MRKSGRIEAGVPSMPTDEELLRERAVQIARELTTKYKGEPAALVARAIYCLEASFRISGKIGHWENVDADRMNDGEVVRRCGETDMWRVVVGPRPCVVIRHVIHQSAQEQISADTPHLWMKWVTNQ